MLVGTLPPGTRPRLSTGGRPADGVIPFEKFFALGNFFAGRAGGVSRLRAASAGAGGGDVDSCDPRDPSGGDGVELDEDSDIC